MLLLATSLLRVFPNAAVPDAVAAAARADPAVERLAGRIMARWQAGEPTRPPGRKTLASDWLRLHDGVVRRARYAARTSFLPKPRHVASIALPKHLGFAYVAIKAAHDLLALPLWRAHQGMLVQVKHSRDALAASDLPLALVPASAGTKRNIRRLRMARAEAERKLAADTNDVAAWHTLGNALSGLKRYRQAIACYDKALTIVPDNRAVWRERGAAVSAYGNRAGSPDSDKEAMFDPQDADAWTRRAGFFASLQRYGEAIAASDHALRMNPTHPVAMRVGIRSRIYACDWSRREDDERRVAESLRTGAPIIRPFNHQLISGSADEQRLAARLFARGFRQPARPLSRGGRYGHDRIRLAYLSPDFRDSAMAILMAGVFEHHDKAHFETTAISLGPDERGGIRRRLEAAFEHFFDASAMSDAALVVTMREREVDIAIDLRGYGGGGRPGSLPFGRPPCR